MPHPMKPNPMSLFTNIEEVEDDIEMVSDCCGETVYEDHDICSSCKDHCGSELANLDDFDWESK